MTDFNPLQPKVVLGIAAHPDDLDFGASATMAVFAEQGAAVHYLILTDGGKGSEDRTLTSAQLSAVRHKEQEQALQLLGGQSVTFLDYPDGELQVTMELKSAIVRKIRELKPDVVVTMDPSMIYVAERGFINHPDHRAAGQAALDAVFPLARDHLSCPKLLEEGLEPHNTTTVLLINLQDSNFAVDVTATFNRKLAALKAHASQMKDYDKVSTMMRGIAEESGAKYGYELAESFIRIDVS